MSRISVLIPTRWREKELRESVESCIEMASDPSCLEFGFLIDAKDDRTRGGLYSWLPDNVRHFVIETNMLRGYQDIHEMYNMLGRCSTGGWLWVFADDCYVRTQGWDQMVLSEGDGSGLAVLQMEMNGHPVCQPIISRGLFNLLGWFAPHFSLDRWLYHLGLDCGIQKMLDFRIDHLRFGMEKPFDEVRNIRDEALLVIEEDPNWHVLDEPWISRRKIDEEKIKNALR